MTNTITTPEQLQNIVENLNKQHNSRWGKAYINRLLKSVRYNNWLEFCKNYAMLGEYLSKYNYILNIPADKLWKYLEEVHSCQTTSSTQ